MAADLNTIRTKVRRLTRSPSEAQITTAQIDDYINTFIQYDFPEQLRLFTLRTTLTFFTKPYVDTYATNTVNANDPLYNFKDKYTTVHPPVYIDGYYTAFSQSRDSFYASYPMTNSVRQIGTGTGALVNFAGTLTDKPMLQNNVTITAIDVDNLAITLVDIPRYDVATGYPTQVGDLVTPNEAFSRGTVNYVTGVYDLTFPTPPAAGTAIYSHTIPYQASRPSMVLYYDNKFVVRPIPDKVYRATIEAYVRPTELLAANQDPELEQWWKYIAYGASKSIFEDRMDTESIQAIIPGLKEQEALVLRRTIVQQSNERVQTIYSGQSDYIGGGWNRSGTYF